MSEYIEREEVALKVKRNLMPNVDVDGTVSVENAERYFLNLLAEQPVADVVSREVFEQVKWERDAALHTLQEHGIGLGEKSDVVEVVRCKDCELYKAYSNPLEGFYGQCLVRECNIGENDYCSYGIKKEGAEE